MNILFLNKYFNELKIIKFFILFFNDWKYMEKKYQSLKNHILLNIKIIKSNYINLL